MIGAKCSTEVAAESCLLTGLGVGERSVGAEAEG